MQKSKITGLLCAVILSALASTAVQAQELPGVTAPKAGLTKGEAMAAFGKAVFIACLGSLEQGKPIVDLTDAEKQDLQPATPEERKFQHPKNKDTAVWISKTLGSHLAVMETSPQRCDVRADQLPVDATFQSLIQMMAHVAPEFQAVPQKPGYNPIVDQLEADKDGAHYVVHLEGAEPGQPFHAYRFSLLTAWVTRQSLK